jgi:hypothetical protein
VEASVARQAAQAAAAESVVRAYDNSQQQPHQATDGTLGTGDGRGADARPFPGRRRPRSRAGGTPPLRQQGLAHQELVDALGRRPALGDGPHNQ